MRTEEEFMALVEEKLAARPVKRPMGMRGVLIAATLALLTAAAFGTAVLLNREDELTPPETVEGVSIPVSIQPEIVPGEGTIDTSTAAVIPPYIYVATGKYYATETGVDGREDAPWPETWFDNPQIVFPVPGEITYDGRTYVRWTRGMGEPLDPAVSVRGRALGDDLYALAGVSTEYYILKEKNGLWGYLNYNYRPATLAQLIADLNLTENLHMGTLYYNTFNGRRYNAWQIDGLDGAKLWEMLFANLSAAPQRLTVKIDPEAIVQEAQEQGAMVSPPYDPTGEYIYERTLASDINIGISLPALGIENLSIGVSREGWMWTNLLSSGNYFAVSPTLVDEILAYAKAEGNVQDITPVEPVTAPATAAPSLPEDVVTASTATAEETVTYSPPQRP